jgi:hypothetical protein
MSRKTEISSHESANMISDEWITPPEIIKELGPFDLDPCSPINRPWPTAQKYYTINDNGLLMPCFGFVWCNPPYGKFTVRWLELMSMHNNGIALIFARTETDAFYRFVWKTATSILFIKGRLYFYTVDGIKGKSTGGAPSCLIAYGSEADNRLKNCSIKGKYLKIKQ